MNDFVERNARGRWVKGTTPNPEGKNGREKGWQPYGIRVQKWLNMSAEEVIAIYKDKEKMTKLTSIDLVCVKQVVGMLGGPKSIEERETCIDRIEGKSCQSTTIKGDGESPLVINVVKPSADDQSA